MNLQKINFKIFFKNADAAKPDTFFKVFNDWIPGSPEIFIDVASYAHVSDGPKTILVGHHVDLILDDSGQRRGFVYAQKTEIEGTNAQKISSVFSKFIKTSQKLAAESDLKGVELVTNEIQLTINDRGIAPNTQATFDALKNDITQLFDKVYGAGQYQLTREENPKQRFSVLAKSSKSPSLDDLAKLAG